jgi:hypothetical protein
MAAAHLLISSSGLEEKVSDALTNNVSSWGLGPQTPRPRCARRWYNVLIPRTWFSVNIGKVGHVNNGIPNHEDSNILTTSSPCMHSFVCRYILGVVYWPTEAQQRSCCLAPPFIVLQCMHHAISFKSSSRTSNNTLECSYRPCKVNNLRARPQSTPSLPPSPAQPSASPITPAHSTPS